MRILLFLIITLCALSVRAEEVSIGYLHLVEEPGAAREVYTGLALQPPVDPVVGARLGLEDAAMQASAMGLSLQLLDRMADAQGLDAAVDELVAKGAGFIVTDLPADLLQALVRSRQGAPLTFVNATAEEDQLRAACLPNLMHTAASDRMRADALAQYLRSRNWTRLLVLQGPEQRDAEVATAFLASAARFRLAVEGPRLFTLSTDPAQREANNPLLLTGDADYDLLFIADADGEYARFLPYATALPRPLAGATGLVASAWHWSLERYGAPQVNSRFEALAGRRMTDRDWSAWMAVRAVAAAYVRAGSTDFEAVDTFLRGDRLRLDGSKGMTMNFRSWDGQLRMPMVLATESAVIAMAPVDGFLHETNILDTLGTDAPEQQCP